MKYDNDFPYILQFIGIVTLFGLFIFMTICTIMQIDSWIESSNTTCEVTNQKE